MPDDIVCIKTFQHRHEAGFAQGFLELNGIPSYVSADDLSGMRPQMLFATGGARLMVLRGDAEKALLLLEAPANEGHEPDTEVSEAQ